MVGQTISHYRVLGQIGAGGMGVVYRGEDLRLGRAVALKFVSEDLAHDQHAVQRLRAEARAASALNHGNICTIYDIDEHEGHPFIVMELLKGRTLRDHLADGPLKIHQLVDFGIQIADALHAAHSEGIIHRDIKPGNLFVTERGQVKILDFGLAKLKPLFDATGTTRDVRERTSRGVTLGTTGYMSPEQATGEELDTRTDLFSLGVVLYECATGRHPFPGKSSAVVLSAILNRSPTPPSALNPELPVRVQEVINNCLEKDRELRYQSAADLRADLKRVRRDIESGHSEAIEPARSGASPSSRSASGAAAVAPTARGTPRWQAAAAIAAIALVVGAGAYVVWQREQIPPLERQRIDPAPDSSPPVLALAAASLDARNYRAAVSYAEQVLAVQPDNAGAMKIRDAARAALQRFDAAIADARKRLAAKDVRGATQALDVARGIDAASPAVIEIGSLIAEQTRPREPAARATQSARTPEDAPRTIERAPTTRATGKPQAAPGSDTPPQPDAKIDVPPPSVPPGPLPAPPVTATPPAAAQQPPAPAQEPPAPAQQPPKAAPTPSASSGDTPQRSAAPTGPSKDEEDQAAIRRLVATFTRAIENKDVALYRSIRPNLSREEERRLQDGFRAVTSQRVDLRITGIDLRGDEATVTLRRRDTIRAGGQQQVSEEREQRMMLARTAGAWRIVDIR